VTLPRGSEPAQRSQTPLSRLTELAKQDPKRKFSSIAHLLTPQALHEAFRSLRKDAGAGVDAVTYRDYEKQANGNIEVLWEKLKSKQYRAQPLRRIYIPKEDGKLRAISIPSLEDKIVQKAMVRLLEAIWEVDFLACSYGSRPGRNPHQALDEIDRIIFRESISHVLELDITSYFDAIVRKHLMEKVERRISDSSILRLLGKWINVGVVDDGRLLISETGVGQGQVISPFLANIYLHHGAPGQTWCFQRVKFPPRQEVQPPHRESSLGSAKVTTWTKRRQSDARAVTKVKQISLVKYLSAGRQHRSGWQAPVGSPQMARWPETAAGSVCTARSEKEASRDLGDPPRSRSALGADRVCRTIWLTPEKGRRCGGSRIRW
jgi:hypothetical protein